MITYTNGQKLSNGAIVIKVLEIGYTDKEQILPNQKTSGVNDTCVVRNHYAVLQYKMGRKTYTDKFVAGTEVITREHGTHQDTWLA